MIALERLHELNRNDERPRGRYVLLLIQQSQRASFNHALEWAIERANALDRPLLAVFGLFPRYPEAGRRPYRFMLEGLTETKTELARRGIRLVIRPFPPDEAALSLADQAALIVTDVGYLRIQRDWRRRIGANAPCRTVAVESDAVVPVETAMPKEAWSAASLRAHLRPLWPRFLVPLAEGSPRRSSLRLSVPGPSLDLDPARLDDVLDRLGIREGPPPTADIRGGLREARRRLERFLKERLAEYPNRRNDPTVAGTSELSPYLHFGQISPLEIALAVREAWHSPAIEAYLEQLLVRRELALNFVWFNPAYDRYDGLPEWARRSLAMEGASPRAFSYDRTTFDAAATHDPLWNAAQRQLVRTGFLPNVMRMYWGKKILEWSPTPEAAFETALALNNRYELDGRDPNGFAGVGWCFGLHDRPWPRRPIFGHVRTMTAQGLARKFSVEAYLRQWGSHEC